MPYDDNWWCNSNETNSKYPMVFCMINLEHKSLDYLFFFSSAKSSLSSFSFSKMLQILWLSCWSPSLFKQEMTGTCINWISKLSDLTSSNLSLDRLHWMSHHYTFLSKYLPSKCTIVHMISKIAYATLYMYMSNIGAPIFFLKMSYTWYAKLVLGKFIEIY